MKKTQGIISVAKLLSFYIFALLLWPINLALGIIIIPYRRVIDIILRIKFGRKYGGLVNTADSAAIIKDVPKFIILNTMTLKSDAEKDFDKILAGRIRKRIFDSPDNYPKLTSTVHSFAGYSYYIKNDYEFKDAFKLFHIPNDVHFDENHLKEVASSVYATPFGKKDKGLWDITVFNRGFSTKKQDGLYYYPFIIRFDHVVGDGVSLMTLFMQVFGDEKTLNYNHKIFGKTRKNYNAFDMPLVYLRKVFNWLTLGLYIFFIGPGKAIKKASLEYRSNPLHGIKQSGEKIFAWHVEDDREYIPIVKNIKNRVPNTTFSNVICASVTGSLSNYFKRNSQSIYDVFTTVSPLLLKFPHMDSSEPVKLENNETMMFLKFPLNKSNSLLKTLEEVKLRAKEGNYGDALVNGFILSNFFGLLPLSIRTQMASAGSHTCIVSNVPGISLVSIDGCVVDKIIPSTPNAFNVGISFCILSYDDRFQVGLLVDKAFISRREEAQQIVDDVFINIKLLDAETRKIYLDN